MVEALQVPRHMQRGPNRAVDACVQACNFPAEEKHD